MSAKPAEAREPAAEFRRLASAAEGLKAMVPISRPSYSYRESFGTGDRIGNIVESFCTTIQTTAVAIADTASDSQYYYMRGHYRMAATSLALALLGSAMLVTVLNPVKA